MKDVANQIRESVVTHVMRDLNPSWEVVWLKVVLAAIIGGFLSLFICGQFGLGMTTFAQNINSLLHQHTHPYICALVCGGLFAILPVTVLRLLLCSPLQFRAIVQRRWYVLLIGFGGIGGFLESQGHHGVDFITFSVWVFAALLVAHIVSRAFNIFLPAIDLRPYVMPSHTQ